MSNPSSYTVIVTEGATGLRLFRTATSHIQIGHVSYDKHWQLDNRMEADWAGVYLIQKSDGSIYIGETSNLKKRGFASHQHKQNAISLIVITADNNTFHTSIIKYLEYRLIQLATEHKVQLANDAEPKLPKISESDMYDSEHHLQYVLKQLPIYGIDCLGIKIGVPPTATTPTTSTSTGSPSESPSATPNQARTFSSKELCGILPEDACFFMTYHGKKAMLIPRDGVFKLKAGSEIVDPPRPSLATGYLSVEALRTRIIQAGKVQQGDGCLTLLADITVNSATAAASLVAGVNYRAKAWLDENGVSLADYPELLETQLEVGEQDDE